jgi:hypothetical protein
MAGVNERHWTITPQGLSEVINSKRKELHKTPISHNEITTRLILKSNIDHPGIFDFEAPKLLLNEHKMALLEQLLNDQFGLHMTGKLARLCQAHTTATKPATPAPTPQPVSVTTRAQNSGIIAKLKRLIGL